MTLPNERRNAVNRTKAFLRKLLDPKATPKVPKIIRQEARSCLRHFPSEYEMELAGEFAPGVFGEWDGSKLAKEKTTYHWTLAEATESAAKPPAAPRTKARKKSKRSR